MGAVDGLCVCGGTNGRGVEVAVIRGRCTEQLRLRAGLWSKLHDLEVIARTGDCALGSVDQEAHHGHWLARHVNQLNEHDHGADGEFSRQRTQEKQQVDACEDDIQNAPAKSIHAVPPR